jgi:hypothetical protein
MTQVREREVGVLKSGKNRPRLEVNKKTRAAFKFIRRLQCLRIVSKCLDKYTLYVTEEKEENKQCVK